MAPNYFIDKVVASAFLFALFNVNEGHGFFYQQPAIPQHQGHQQPFYDYPEPPNRVGYGFKPSWADVHLQPLAEETPQYQQPQYQQAQYPQEQPVEKSSYQPQPQPQPQQEITQPQYTLPAHTYLQPSEKYQISAPKYQWAVQPSVKYNIPTITNPLTYRDPHQHVNVFVPLRLFGVQSFPPFLERLIQRVQTYYSIYNPPETLTVPYNINTPPTFSASSLLPPSDAYLPPGDESNVINANIPNFETNSVENNEGVIENSETPSDSSIDNRIGGLSTESSETSESTTEGSMKEESSDTTTATTSSDDTSSPTSSDAEGDKTETSSSDKSETESKSDDNGESSSKSDDVNSETTNESTEVPSSEETSKSDDDDESKNESTTAANTSESSTDAAATDSDKES